MAKLLIRSETHTLHEKAAMKALAIVLEQLRKAAFQLTVSGHAQAPFYFNASIINTQADAVERMLEDKRLLNLADDVDSFFGAVA